MISKLPLFAIYCIILLILLQQISQVITNILVMNSKSRILPHLNSYFLQRRAYEAHRKKIQEIGKPLAQSKLKKSQIIEEMQPEKKQKPDKNPLQKSNDYAIRTIQQENNKYQMPQISPRAKRWQRQVRQQNNRLIQKIRKCASTINRKQIQKHRAQTQSLKQRLSKFISHPQSHKTLMRCKYSLEAIHQKEREKKPSVLFTHPQQLIRISKSQLLQLGQQRLKEHRTKQSRIFKFYPDKFYLFKNNPKYKQSLKGSRLKTIARTNFQLLKNESYFNLRKRRHSQIDNSRLGFPTLIEN